MLDAADLGKFTPKIFFSVNFFPHCEVGSRNWPKIFRHRRHFGGERCGCNYFPFDLLLLLILKAVATLLAVLAVKAVRPAAQVGPAAATTSPAPMMCSLRGSPRVIPPLRA